MRELIGKFLFSVVALAIMGLTTGSANAALITYGDLASWNAAVSGASTETIPDPAPQQYLSFGMGNASHTYGSLTYAQSTVKDNADSDLGLFNIGSLYSGNPAVISSQNYNLGSEEYVNILIEFSSSVQGFALNYGTFDAKDVTFTLSNGHTFTQGSSTSNFGSPNFAAATDDLAFTSVLVTSTNLEFALYLNNVSFATGFSTIPEPSTLALLGIGGMGLALSAIRRRIAMAIERKAFHKSTTKCDLIKTVAADRVAV